MADTTTIEWTDHTWNPWYGCKKISPGCKYCYMYRDQTRYGMDPTNVSRSKTKFNEPKKWKEPGLVFTCSWSDFFIDEADQWRDEAWQIIKDTPHLTYQILTKRPEDVLQRLPADWGTGYPNVWLGVSVESQHEDWRIFELMDIPAALRFVSFEPLIGPVKWNPEWNIDWIIIGGETGNEEGPYRYRPAEIDWFVELINGAILYDVAIFVKQLGTHLAKQFDMEDTKGLSGHDFLMLRDFPDTTTTRT